MSASRPPLVYGLLPFHGGSLAVLAEDRATRLADELDRVKACTTYGDLRAVAPGLTQTRLPVSDDALRGMPDDEPFRWTESEDWLAGVWPPLPTSEIYVRRGAWEDDGLLADLNANLTVLVEPSERHGDGAKDLP